ncbi:hypothetical protein F7725_010860 [Dissostichus mawsoni]|uniref:Ig-like domain-containing protein n=1 Tax=Dissostichus mawsoni TaxID=36200 RepID=A0A7J5Z9D5_DISMA|nr:hypothetical protein F7725_010860 [Dissostichus mawsoni]
MEHLLLLLLLLSAGLQAEGTLNQTDLLLQPNISVSLHVRGLRGPAAGVPGVQRLHLQHQLLIQPQYPGGSFLLSSSTHNYTSQLGSTFSISCSIQPQYPGGSFLLSSFTNNYTQPAVNHSAHFLFPAAEPPTRKLQLCLSPVASPLRAVCCLSLSQVSSVFTVCLSPVYLSPVSLSPVSLSLSQGFQVFRGSTFSISCSIQPQYPGGSFLLSSSTHNYTQPAVNHSAHFLFPAAEPAHQGNYSCVYHLLVRSHSFSSESRLLSVTVSGKLSVHLSVSHLSVCLSLSVSHLSVSHLSVCLSLSSSVFTCLSLTCLSVTCLSLTCLSLTCLSLTCLSATRGQRGHEDMELQEVNLAVMSLQATRV